jgi:GDPmannose 4,6-dehydratase
MHNARDYVEAMWLMLQQDQPEDYVIATGVTTTVREFARMAFAEAGILVEFEGRGQKEVGRVVKCLDPAYFVEPGRAVVKVDTDYFRPTEVDLLIGDAAKARQQLGWVPQITVSKLVKDMMESDLKLFERERVLKSNGLEVLKTDM